MRFATDNRHPSLDKQAETDLTDNRGGTFDGKPAKAPLAPHNPDGPSQQLDENTPEGLQRERKGPLNPKTGRA